MGFISSEFFTVAEFASFTRANYAVNINRLRKNRRRFIVRAQSTER